MFNLSKVSTFIIAQDVLGEGDLLSMVSVYIVQWLVFAVPLIVIPHMQQKTRNVLLRYVKLL